MYAGRYYAGRAEEREHGRAEEREQGLAEERELHGRAEEREQGQGRTGLATVVGVQPAHMRPSR
jgi:hypothetical protein